MRGVNDGEAVELLRFCLDHGYQLRFIEQMPLDAQHGWERTEMITAGEVMDRLSGAFTLTPDPTGSPDRASPDPWIRCRTRSASPRVPGRAVNPAPNIGAQTAQTLVHIAVNLARSVEIPSIP